MVQCPFGDLDDDHFDNKDDARAAYEEQQKKEAINNWVRKTPDPDPAAVPTGGHGGRKAPTGGHGAAPASSGRHGKSAPAYGGHGSRPSPRGGHGH